MNRLATAHSTPLDPPQVPGTDGQGGDAPEQVERFVERHRRSLELLTRTGWLAKGVVYVLFGVTAIAIARQSAPSDEASPKGALGKLLEAPAGRGLLAVIAVGLLLYCVWRAASAVLVDGSDLEAWGDRAGYSFSALFYVALGVVAAQSAWRGTQPDRSSTVESVSRSLLESGIGRWVLAAGGIATIAVGVFFVVRKALMRSFADDVAGVTEDGWKQDGLDRVIWFAGVSGWIGRGVVTALVGYFVLRSAIDFDPDEARGFDRALREATTSTTGSVLVWVSGIGLISYGIFCLSSHRRRTLADRS
jgi:hypothetical protein